MNKSEIEKLKDPEEKDWNAFFAKISVVCPWSQKYWNQNQIEIVEWTGEIFELSKDCVARVYKCPEMLVEVVTEFAQQLNRERLKEQWFWSFPSVSYIPNPVTHLIQQDRAFLTDIRNRYMHSVKRK